MAYRNLFTPVPPTPASAVSGVAMPAGVRSVDADAFVSAFVKSVKRKLPDGVYTGIGKDSASQWQDVVICLRIACKGKHEAFSQVIGTASPVGGVYQRANEIIFQSLHAICDGEAAKTFHGHDDDMDGRRMFFTLQAKHAQTDRAARKAVERDIREMRFGRDDPTSKLDELLLLFRRLDAIIGVARQPQDNVSDMMDAADCEDIYGVGKRVANRTGHLAAMDGGEAREFLLNEWRDWNSERRQLRQTEGSLLNSPATVDGGPASVESVAAGKSIEQQALDEKKLKALEAVNKGDFKFVADLYYSGQYRKAKGKGKGEKGSKGTP